MAESESGTANATSWEQRTIDAIGRAQLSLDSAVYLCELDRLFLEGRSGDFIFGCQGLQGTGQLEGVEEQEDAHYLAMTTPAT